MKHNYFGLLSLLLCLILFGCNQSPDNSPTIATSTNQIRLSETKEPSPTTVKESKPDTISAPPGLIYCSENGLFAVRQNGNSCFLIPDCHAYFSPDYQYVLFEEVGEYFVVDLFSGEIILNLGLWDSEKDPEMLYADELYAATWSDDNRMIYYTAGRFVDHLTDIWSINTETEERKNLSNTDNRIEGAPRLFDKQNMLVFNSYPVDDIYINPYFSGYFTSMNKDGSEYQVHSGEKDNGYFKVSPDRSAAAIIGGKIYEQDQGIRDFFFSIEDNIDNLNLNLLNPAWAPNNNYIAWSLYNMQESSGWAGIGIFDVENGTLKLVYPYLDPTREGLPPAPKWSPNSEWITVSTLSIDATIDLRLIKVDGTEEYGLGEYDNIVWGTESNRIILNPSILVLGNQSGVWITRIGEWDPIMINLPLDTVAIDWIDPSIVQKWVGLDNKIVD
jgi:hypothetical protein